MQCASLNFLLHAGVSSSCFIFYRGEKMCLTVAELIDIVRLIFLWGYTRKISEHLFLLLLTFRYILSNSAARQVIKSSIVMLNECDCTLFVS